MLKTSIPFPEPLGNGIVPGFLSSVYRGGIAMRNLLYNRVPALSGEPGRPTVSVGGIHAGGTGKTPLSLLVGKYFVEKGFTVAFLSRGYGRRSRETVICKPGSRASWELVGDEPALLHAAVPESWLGVSPIRTRAANSLCSVVPQKTVFIMDDGFQHRRMKRTIDIVCLPPDPFADTLIPGGTLREPLKNCNRAHCICVIGERRLADELGRTREKLAPLFPGKNIHILYQVPTVWRNLGTGETSADLPLKRPVLLSGIARPDRFSYLVERMGVHPSESHFFRDHHAFTREEIEKLCGSACDGIITTEKDAFRLNTIKLVYGPEIWYLKIDLCFSDVPSEELFFARLNDSIQSNIPTRRYPS